MARRQILTASLWSQLMAPPSEDREVAMHCTLTPDEIEAVAGKRTAAARLGYAVSLAYLRYPGRVRDVGEQPNNAMLAFLADQVDASASDLAVYDRRPQTRREHIAQIMARFGYQAFTRSLVRELVHWLTPSAGEDPRAEPLAISLIEELRRRRILIPARRTVELIVRHAFRRAENVRISALTRDLHPDHYVALRALIAPPESGEVSTLSWLKAAPKSASAKSIKAVFDRLMVVRAIGLPSSLRQNISTSALDSLAGEGLRITVQNLRRMAVPRLWAVLSTACLRLEEQLTDLALDMFDKLLGRSFRKAERQSSDKASRLLMDIIRPMQSLKAFCRESLTARLQTGDLNGMLGTANWDEIESATSAIETALGEGKPDKYSELIGKYQTTRQFAPLTIKGFNFKGPASAASLLRAVDLLRIMFEANKRSLPDNPPTGFIRKVWRPFVFPASGEINRRAYELCVYFELRDRLRAGDVWVEGSRQHRNFDDRLIPKATFEILRAEGSVPIAAAEDAETYLADRQQQIEEAITIVAARAEAGTLPDVAIQGGTLSITPITDETPDAATAMSRLVYGQLPQIKIPDLLTEVNAWTGFADCFTHYRSGRPATDQKALFAAVLADGINLSVSRMAAATHNLSARQIAWAHDWHLREETYSAALACLIDMHRELPLAKLWGDGVTSSSDGQFFRAGGRGEASADINAKYGRTPGLKFYTHISDQFSPFHSTVITATESEAPFVLDGLLRHQSGLAIEEHHVDTGGATDHVFALCYLLGFRFAPRLRNFKDRKLYLMPGMKPPTIMTPFIGGTIKVGHIIDNWPEILRLATSIKAGTTTASSILKSLSAYPRQNGLAIALRELGRLERTLFALEWMRSLELRKRTSASLARGEARNALARGVFFNQLGEMRDRSYEHQIHKASGLNFLVAAIILWNTKYLEASITDLRNNGVAIPTEITKHIAPLGWAHVGLTGDYLWNMNSPFNPDRLRPLRKNSLRDAA
ncbi:Tn3 family transposase [Tateyamaria sp.]|uniref:Tn3 family transposase n=1 Tax=Tateyamaria sp. TaxID=1929288 RepID=UPI003B21CDDA